MSTTEKYAVGTIATLMSTELNSLADSTNALASAAYNNTQGGGGGDGYAEGLLELVVTFGTSPATTGAVSVWFLAQPDGTNYEDGGSSVTPARVPDLQFPLRAVTTGQRITRRTLLPPGNFKPLVRNDSTGQSFAGSGNTLKVLPFTPQGV